MKYIAKSNTLGSGNILEKQHIGTNVLFFLIFCHFSVYCFFALYYFFHCVLYSWCAVFSNVIFLNIRKNISWVKIKCLHKTHWKNNTLCKNKTWGKTYSEVTVHWIENSTLEKSNMLEPITYWRSNITLKETTEWGKKQHIWKQYIEGEKYISK